jgi:hypothetical protein
MNTKLTLRIDNALIETAKSEASRRGKSVSRMVGEFFDFLATSPKSEPNLPPLTASLFGLLKDKGLSEADYKKHLREKYL